MHTKIHENPPLRVPYPPLIGCCRRFRTRLLVAAVDCQTHSTPLKMLIRNVQNNFSVRKHSSPGVGSVPPPSSEGAVWRWEEGVQQRGFEGRASISLSVRSGGLLVEFGWCFWRPGPSNLRRTALRKTALRRERKKDTEHPQTKLTVAKVGETMAKAGPGPKQVVVAKAGRGKKKSWPK